MALINLRALVLIPLTIAIVGCGSDLARVSGVVTLDGQPLDHGRVTFQADGKPMGIGEIEPGGAYEVRTGTQPGMSPGEYRVAITSYQTRDTDDDLGEPIPVLLTPAKYNSPDNSGLSAHVEKGHNEFDFRLDSRAD